MNCYHCAKIKQQHVKFLLKILLKMDQFLTRVRIKELRHLENIEITLSADERQHLLLKGDNPRDFSRGLNRRHLTKL